VLGEGKAIAAVHQSAGEINLSGELSGEVERTLDDRLEQLARRFLK
jgi:hypothetical protein